VVGQCRERGRERGGNWWTVHSVFGTGASGAMSRGSRLAGGEEGERAAWQ
jgi:hypothetical protein